MSEAALVPIEILLVEDDPGDADLTVLTLQQSKLHSTISVVNDGEQAMARLRLEPPYQQAHRPDLILLDLNLPRKSGLEVLAEVKQDPQHRQVPHGLRHWHQFHGQAPSECRAPARPRPAYARRRGRVGTWPMTARLFCRPIFA